MTDKEKIIQYLDFKGISKNKFYNKTGLSVGFLDSGSSLGVDKLRIIVDNYHDFNTDWLIKNEGPMIKPFHSTTANIEQVNEDSVKYGQTKSEYLLRTDNRRTEQLVPLYNIEASAGLVQLFQRDQSTPIDYISIPNLPKCDGAIYVTGDSMYPLLKSGDIVMYKQVLDIHNSLFWGEMYIIHIDIDGDSFTTVKYVHKSDMGSDYIKLVSQNQHHSPKDIQLKHIKAAALVKASIRINSMV